MCPQCRSENIRISEFDYGRDPETGYHDTGCVVRCLDCGYECDGAEWDTFMQAEIARETAEREAEEFPEIPAVYQISVQVAVPNIPEWRKA